MNLEEEIRLRIENRRLLKRARDAYSLDISLPSFSKYLQKRVKSTMADSLSKGYDYYDEAFKALRYLRNVAQVILATPEVSKNERQAIIANFIGPLVRFSESTFLFDDALLLAMSGRYTSALSILRSAIECMVTGSYYHGLLSPNLREQSEKSLKWKPRNSNRSIGEIIEHVLASNQGEIITGLVLELKVEQALNQQGPSLLPPSFGNMLQSVISMFSLYPLDDPKKFINQELYQELCTFTHVSQEATSYWTQKDERVDFDSGSFSEERTVQFTNYFLRALDSVGVLFFSSAIDLLHTPQALEMLLLLEHDIGKHADKLPNSVRAVLALLQVERTK
jgi:hypothetical protein